MKSVYKTIVPVFLALIVVIFAVAFLSEHQLKAALINEEFLKIEELISRKIPQYLEERHFQYSYNSASQKHFRYFSEEIKSPSLARITIWDRNHIIVFSDLKPVIAFHAPRHPDLKRLFSEERSFFTMRDTDIHTPTQSQVGEFLDIYVPVRLSGKVVGAVQVHSVIAAIVLPIDRQSSRVTYILFASGISILVVVYFLAKHLKEERDRHKAAAVRNAELYERSKEQASELEKARQIQTDFAAMIVHDLRSPLTSIIGTAALLKEGLLGPLNHDQRRWLSKMESSSRTMVDLVSDFLDISKLEAGEVNLDKRKVDLNQLVQESLDNHVLLAKDKRVSLASRLDTALPRIQVDPSRLDQVLNNLLSNALKFTPEGGEIEVGTSRQDRDGTKIWVKDSGV
ncbi:MAG: sensor histidine kinase, partial [Candidatus Binatia bacterium]